MGKPAARIGDMHVCPMVTGVVPHVGGPVTGPGVPTVLIGGMPAVTIGDMCTCTGPPDVIVLGSMGVLVGGKPAARMGDMTAHGGNIVLGCMTVLIGDAGGGGSGSGGISGGEAPESNQSGDAKNSKSLKDGASKGDDKVERNTEKKGKTTDQQNTKSKPAGNADRKIDDKNRAALKDAAKAGEEKTGRAVAKKSDEDASL